MTLTDIISKVTRYAKNIIVTDNSSTSAVNIIQSGSGKAITANGSIDIANSTAFDAISIDQNPSGNAIAANAPIKIESSNGAILRQNTFGNAVFSFVNMQRGRGTASSPQPAQNGDTVGAIVFSGYDGSTSSLAGQIAAFVDGTPSSGKIPLRMEFQTKNDSNNYQARIVIDNDGDVGINTTAPSSKFHVAGDVTLTFTTTSTSVGAAGAGSALPATPVGYLVVSINGTARKIPYYNI